MGTVPDPPGEVIQHGVWGAPTPPVCPDCGLHTAAGGLYRDRDGGLVHVGCVPLDREVRDAVFESLDGAVTASGDRLHPAVRDGRLYVVVGVGAAFRRRVAYEVTFTLTADLDYDDEDDEE